MNYTVSKEKDTVIVSPAGRLDSVTSPTFEEHIREFLRAPACNLLLDCDDLDYISSAGLRVILNAAKVYKDGSWQFAACSMQDHVREVFEISGFDSFIMIYNSVGDFLQKHS